jgi:hypothetical protein
VEEYSRRFSFTCARCEKRATPPSVRFLGRRVYVAVVLMLVSPRGGPQAEALLELLSLPIRTLDRWRAWWSREFVQTPFWRSRRERFAEPLIAARLPESLSEVFGGQSAADRMAQLLRFLAPLSTQSAVA